MAEAEGAAEADALQSLEVTVVPMAATMSSLADTMAAAVLAEAVMVATGLMGQTIHSVLEMAQVVPLEEVGQ
jgi:hypothetical protein